MYALSLSAVALLAFAAFFTIRLLRTLPILRDYAGRKPLGCNVCMSFWVVGAWAVALAFVHPPVGLGELWVWPPGAGVCLALLEWLGQPPPAGLP